MRCVLLPCGIGRDWSTYGGDGDLGRLDGDEPEEVDEHIQVVRRKAQQAGLFHCPVVKLRCKGCGKASRGKARRGTGRFKREATRDTTRKNLSRFGIVYALPRRVLIEQIAFRPSFLPMSFFAMFATTEHQFFAKAAFQFISSLLQNKKSSDLRHCC